MVDSRGDCTAAVPAFERVAAGIDRALAARALVYLGSCYERLGNEKARQAYRRVIDQYPEQRAATTQARARLAALDRTTRPTAEETFEKRWRSAVPARARLAADQTFASYVTGTISARGTLAGSVLAGQERSESLVTVNLDTSETRLWQTVSSRGGHSESVVASADQSAVVYVWIDELLHCASLRVVDRAGGTTVLSRRARHRGALDRRERLAPVSGARRA